ncbi:unnamed protein product [Macrosiphum euphorbiae]|uniref:TTF-type domain-containing protein n=1 Tax=Macrosiphum euphorbiae TaxID=13131 RepID=A0AAV0Y4T2_9HEMI|nr:unnamed protein product [Macrosiphum euphorbiae]
MSYSAKRTRLSGAEYQKTRIARELEISKQKDRILNFFQPVPTSNSQNKNNNISSDNTEIESDNTGVCDNVQALVEKETHVSESNLENDGNLTLKAKTSPEDYCESIECHEDLLIEGNEANNITLSILKDETLHNNSNCEMVEQNDQDFSLVEDTPADSFDLELLKDPKMWPVICDKIRMFLVQKGPYQTHSKSYPKDDTGRRFTINHFFRKLSNGMEVKRSWLVYSGTGDSVFCYCCKLFNETKSSLGKEGYHDWKNIAETLKQHERSPHHETSFLKWKELEIRINNSKTIGNINEKIIKTEIQHWRQVIERIISLIRVLGNQNLALRGTHDKLNLENNGNFLKFVEFLGKFDPVMKEHIIRRITSDEIHTHYLGKEIQNEIINLLAKKIRLHILNCLKKAKYYSIVLDCTPDISNKEQMTMIFRFVTISEDTGEVTINEHFVDFIQLYDTSRFNMTKVLLDKLREFEVKLEDMRGQGYDNGANMRGKHSGVQARILELNSRAFYVPCNAHTLNLVLNDSANCCLEAVSFFSLIQAIYNFFSSSTHRWDILIKYLPGLTVKPLSATRWESRVDAVKAIRFQLNEICDALSDIVEDNTLTNASGVKSRSEAQGI